MLYYNSQSLNNKDVESVVDSLNSKNITQGPFVNKFEKKISNYLKSKYTVVTNSGTSSLYIAIKSLNLKKNSTVIMPAVNFISSYNMCKILNLNIYLADVDPVSGQMQPNHFYECIKKNNLRKIDLLINLHMSGHPNNIKEFYDIKKKFNCYLIEDACHAFGAAYKINNKYFKVGSCKHSDICTFSFHAIKSITTGEGGAICTNNSKFYSKFLLFRSHGIIRSKTSHWKYDVVYPSFNFRLSDINCALGISQLKRINLFLKKRSLIAKKYLKSLSNFSDNILTISIDKKLLSSWHLFKIFINFKKLKTNKKNYIEFMKKNKIFTQFHYIPIYKFSIFKNKIKLPGAEKHFENSISLPLFYDMKISEVKKVIYLTKKFLNRNKNY